MTAAAQPRSCPGGRSVPVTLTDAGDGTCGTCSGTFSVRVDGTLRRHRLSGSDDRIDYVVVRPHIVGNPERGFETEYSSDLVRKPTRQGAIAHGWRAEGHDDWLLAHLRGDVLVRVSWQYEDRDEHEERAAIAETFGWTEA